jgi:hypothetical protein
VALRLRRFGHAPTDNLLRPAILDSSASSVPHFPASCGAMRAWYLAALLMAAIPLPVLSQDAPRRLREVRGVPVDLYDASNLVTSTSWMSGTILWNVVVVVFKQGVTAAQRPRIYELVGAHAVYLDSDDGPPSLFYIVEINPDPDACTVHQAITVLHAQAEVDDAFPEIVSSSDGDGGLDEIPGAPVGSGRECPSGTDLLHVRESGRSDFGRGVEQPSD